MGRIQEKLEKIYGDVSPPMTTIRYFVNEFKSDRTSVLDAKRLCRLNVVTMDEMVNTIDDIILTGRRVKRDC